MTMQPLMQTVRNPGPLDDHVPVSESSTPSRDLSLLGLVEVLLKEPQRLDDLNREERRQAELMETCLSLGLVLPFIAGLAGVRALYRGVSSMAATMPVEKRCRRACFLRRLTVSWAACYTAVSPVLIYRLWEALAPIRR